MKKLIAAAMLALPLAIASSASPASASEVNYGHDYKIAQTDYSGSPKKVDEYGKKDTYTKRNGHRESDRGHRYHGRRHHRVRVWVPGHWSYRHHRRVWVRGHWEYRRYYYWG